MILVSGKAKKRAKRDDCMDAGGRATQDAIAEFTVVNDRLSTFLTQHRDKMALVQRSLSAFNSGYI